MCKDCSNLNSEKPKYYITTAIAYTSKKPHVGNTYEVVLTDAIARYKKSSGYDVFFLTGTDEHGQKIEDYAKSAKLTPKEYVDKVAAEIKDIADKLNCKYDYFIRTTDDYHQQAVQKMFKQFFDQGDIYKSEYEGLYCVPCESFFTESQIIDGCCPDCGAPLKKTKEEAYFFKMSKYADRLKKFVTEENPNFIYPESRKNEMLNNFILPGVQDLCVSRTSFKWGIPVSFDDKHVVYVWLDALSNYITALGFSPDKNNSPLFNKYWPCDCHIIGKDILRFHTIYWPCFLMALGLELPKQVFAHPWFMVGDDKMSKSKNNVIYADDLVELFGVDAVRYYLISEMPHAQDGCVTYEKIIEKYNTDLANTLGNLVNRTIAMNNKYFDGLIKPSSFKEEIDDDLINTCFDTVKNFNKRMEEHKYAFAIDEIMNLARRCNKYIDETTPWVLAKSEENFSRLGTVLYNLLEAIRFITVMIEPIMPQTATLIFNQLNISPCDFSTLSSFGLIKEGEKTSQASPLFARIDEKIKQKEIEQLNKKCEKSQNDNNIIKDEKPEGIITIDDFTKVSLCVAKILNCEAVEKSDKLLKLILNDGIGERQVVSGIATWYKPEDLINKKVIIVSNLKPVKLRGVVSNGMILAADASKDDVKVIFIDDSIPCGAKIR